MFKLLNSLSLVNATAQAEKPKVYVGIDLGTTFSCVGIFQQNQSFEYLSFGGETPDTIPSVVYVDSEQKNDSPQISVGYDAQTMNKSKPNSKNYFYGFKRLMGLLAKHKEVEWFKKSVTYDVERFVPNNGEPINVFPITFTNGKKAQFTPTDLSTLLLSKMFNLITEKYEIMSTVVTTPSYFTVEQERETKKAAQIAGFPKVKISKEPTAACIEYAKTANLKLDQEEQILVFDLGGGTFDISIVEVENDQDTDDGKTNSNITVSKYGGDNFLGGENVNNELFAYFSKQIGKELTSNEALTLRLLLEKFKIDSCTRWKDEPKATMKEVFFDANGTKHEFVLTQDQFDKLVKPVYDKIDNLLFSQSEGLFRTSNTNLNKFDKPVKIETIKKIVLVGGSTRIPYIKRYLQSKFKNVPIYDSIDPDKSVAAGAARLCMNLDASSGDNSIMLLNVTTLPIGICVSDGSFKPILGKDLVIPIKQHDVFTTVEDNQKAITLQVASGVRPMFSDNHLIGKFDFQIEKPAPRGVPQIEVSCHMDTSYNLTVTAKDLSTGKVHEEVFETDYVGTDKDFVQKILDEAKKHEAEDEETKARLKQMGIFKGAVEMYDTTLKNATNLSEEQKLKFETTIQMYKDWLKDVKSDVKAEDIQTQVTRLEESAKELAEAIKMAGETKQEEPKQDKEHL